MAPGDAGDDAMTSQPAVPGSHGRADRECGEHHPGIGRSWCFEDREWCYPDTPCRGCELPALRAEVERLREHIQILEGTVDMCRSLAKAAMTIKGGRHD